MASVGDYLRDLRDRRGISLEEISRVTRVASGYLEALESDRFSALPPPVFTRGFIRAYCQALGESPDEALARYDGREGGAPPPPRATAAAGTTPAADSEPRSRSAVLVSFVLLVILGMALFAVALMTQPAREDRVDRRPAGEGLALAPQAPTAPSVAEPPPMPSAPAMPSAPVVPSLPPRPKTEAAPPPVPAGAVVALEPARATAPPPWLPDVQAATGGVASPYRLVAHVSEATWIRVRTEDGR